MKSVSEYFEMVNISLEDQDKIMKEYEEGEKPERRKRILLTGCPSSGAPMKVVKAIEENG
jgi:benzoyl-CoA reductase/2-hydroxyglutaryl-CoA dehydratase subunit BcrC/BadD/HgdB